MVHGIRGALAGLVLLVGAAGQTPLQASLWPAAGADAACVDAPLSLTFDQAVRPASGSISISRADGTLVERVQVADLGPADPLPERTLAGGIGPSHAATHYYPVLVDGRRASIFLHDRLEYGQTYSVEVSGGAFVGADGSPSPPIPATAWRFQTRPTPPPAGSTQLVVAADGQGDFCSVQAALDAVPDDPRAPPTTVTVQPGTYTEIVEVNASKPPLVVRGADRDTTRIEYPNNATLNPSSRTRAVFGVDAADFTLSAITIHNLTPNGCGNPGQPCSARGGQAEAFRGDAERLLLDHLTLLSFQDTLQLGSSPNASAFVNASLIAGNVDYTWGYGRAFFQECELRTLARAAASGGASAAAYIAQVRNPEGVPGNVYVHCRLSRDDGVGDGTTYLARIDPRAGEPPAGFPFSQVVFIDSVMDAHINPLGWLLNNAEDAPTVAFWEYHSVTPEGTPLCWTPDDGSPVTDCPRAAFSRQLSADEARHLRR